MFRCSSCCIDFAPAGSERHSQPASRRADRQHESTQVATFRVSRQMPPARYASTKRSTSVASLADNHAPVRCYDFLSMYSSLSSSRASPTRKQKRRRRRVCFSLHSSVQEGFDTPSVFRIIFQECHCGCSHVAQWLLPCELMRRHSHR